jgi:hypothetical protein
MIRAVPVRILRQVLLVIVRPMVEYSMKSARLLPRQATTGRLPVDVDADPPVDPLATIHLQSTAQLGRGGGNTLLPISHYVAAPAGERRAVLVSDSLIPESIHLSSQRSLMSEPGVTHLGDAQIAWYP